MPFFNEADQFTDRLYAELAYDQLGGAIVGLERAGFGAIRVQLPSGTELLIEVGVAELRASQTH